MCSPAIIEQVKKRITRRNLLQGIGLTGAATATGCLRIKNLPIEKPHRLLFLNRFLSRVIDLVIPHIRIFCMVCRQAGGLTRGKRTFIPPAIVEVKPVFEWNPDSKSQQITYWEHVGTHMDAQPFF